MKIGGPKPPPSTHHVKPHRHKPERAQVRGSKQNTELADTSAIAEELQTDGIDETGGARRESGQQGFSGQHQQEKLVEDLRPSEGYTLTEPHLHAMLSAIVDQLETLAEEILADLPAQPQADTPKSLRAKTTGELKDILRQVMSGDYGMRLTQDPSLTFGKLFSSLKKWPKDVPPGKKPPWTEDEWDALIQWLNAPPEMPAEDELL